MLMFGTPSGVVLSPQAAPLLGPAAADLPVQQGYVLAGFDPALPARVGLPRLKGRVEALALAEVATGPMRLVETAQAVAGRGLAGDRYAAKAGTFTPADGAGVGYDLTLVQAEVLDDLLLDRGPPPRLRGGAAQRRHSRHRPQRVGGTPLPARRRGMPRAAAVRTVFSPGTAHHQGRPPRPDPPRRSARRRAHWRLRRRRGHHRDA